MKFRKLLLVMLAVSSFTSTIAVKSYRNHKAVSFKIDTESQLMGIQSLESQSGIVFMDPAVRVHMKIDLVVAPEVFPIFEEVARENEIIYTIDTDDLQSWIDGEKPLKNRKDGFILDQYNSLEEIYQYMDEMQRDHPERASIINIGQSFEGRPLRVMKVTSNESNPVVFVETNIHAREWITSSTSIWIIHEFLTSTDVQIRAIADSITWYFLVVTNPDGLQFSHDENRLWRKTRSNHNLLCRGVDPNRNFGFNWRMGGSDNVACSDNYAGPSPFSENETKALMDFYATIADKAEAYIAIHAPQQMLLYPMGHEASPDLVPNANDLNEIAAAAVAALTAVHGTAYQYGNLVQTLYAASGNSVDHAYGYFKTPLAFTYEVRAGMDPPSRYILPPEQIRPNVEEILASLIVFISKAKELGYFKAEV